MFLVALGNIEEKTSKDKFKNSSYPFVIMGLLFLVFGLHKYVHILNFLQKEYRFFWFTM